MKKTISVIILLCIIGAIGVALWFLDEQQTLKKWYTNTFDNPASDTVIEHARRHSDPNYVCPMHPQIIKDVPGNCPICGMDLVLKEPQKPKKATTAKKIKYWVAPMDANYRRDEPGKSPMGMDLVPVYEEDNDTANENNNGFPEITISANTAQNMGVRIEKARVMPLSRTIKTIGSVSYNEDSLHHVHTRANGWVERVYTQSLGDPVTKGKTLLEFYSPEILAAQKDLIIAKKSGSTLSGRGPSLTEASKIRLRDLNVPQQIIQRIIKTGRSQKRIPIVAEKNGVITRVGIRNGMYITPATEIYTIADLSSVWVMVEVFEHQMTWVKTGNKAEIQVQGVPGKTWIGNIDYIYPELNPKTRTLKVRLKFDSPNQLLKPNMFADVTLYNNHKLVLTVPSEAVIYYENNPRIVKVIGKNKYQPIEIKTGMKADGQVEVLEGISEGDEILVSGQFMIDSESNLQASFRRLGPETNGE